MIANVRNYSKNEFICEPKGMPDDCNKLIKQECDVWNIDGHSHSYLTLHELKEFQSRNIPIKHSGMMTQENAKRVDNGEMPDSWCLWTTESDYVYREWSENIDVLAELINRIEERKREAFWTHKDPESSALDEKIRIVFWFDN